MTPYREALVPAERVIAEAIWRKIYYEAYGERALRPEDVQVGLSKEDFESVQDLVRGQLWKKVWIPTPNWRRPFVGSARHASNEPAARVGVIIEYDGVRFAACDAVETGTFMMIDIRAVGIWSDGWVPNGVNIIRYRCTEHEDCRAVPEMGIDCWKGRSK